MVSKKGKYVVVEAASTNDSAVIINYVACTMAMHCKANPLCWHYCSAGPTENRGLFKFSGHKCMEKRDIPME